jgi:hypothetical protein
MVTAVELYEDCDTQTFADDVTPQVSREDVLRVLEEFGLEWGDLFLPLD